jgi:hypothetical protein
MGSQQTVVHGVHVGDEKIVFLHSNGKLSPTGVCACRVHVAENCVHVVWGFCACRGGNNCSEVGSHKPLCMVCMSGMKRLFFFILMGNYLRQVFVHVVCMSPKIVCMSCGGFVHVAEKDRKGMFILRLQY